MKPPLWRVKQCMRHKMRRYGVGFGCIQWKWSAAAGPYSPLPDIAYFKHGPE